VNIDAIQKAYRRYGRSYDFYFGAILHPGRREVIERMHCRPGDQILEVGVGTGLSLPLYPEHARVTGIDISPEMLARARERQARFNLSNVAGLEVMDAERMSFPDNSFDKVIAAYVASVVPDSVRLVDEMRRVCKPGGELYIVNHFHHAGRMIGGFERLLAPMSRLLGFRPDFSLDNLIARAELEVLEQSPVNLFGYWTLLKIGNNKARPVAVSPPVLDYQVEQREVVS